MRIPAPTVDHDIMFVARRSWEMGRAGSIPRSMCFIDVRNACDSVDRTLQREVLARFGDLP